MDSVGLNALFNIVSTASLFTEAGEQVHFTSALRYPVFVKGENYNGNPHMLKTPFFGTSSRPIWRKRQGRYKGLSGSRLVPSLQSPFNILRALASCGPSKFSMECRIRVAQTRSE